MYLGELSHENQALPSLKDTLLQHGSCLISYENQFLTVDQWKTLNHEVSKLTFEAAQTFKFSKIKSAEKSETYNKPIFDVMTSVQSRRFISALTGLTHFNIDICECHFYEKGAFLPVEWSQDNFKDNHYAIYMLLEDDYAGGEHVITQNGKNETVYRPESGDILVASCQSDHEIKPVIDGNRKHILSLIQPHEARSPR